MVNRNRFLPKMHELLAFAAAAHHANFTGAARELNLTQGAISRSIAELEARLGVTLFQRVRRRVVLTDSGRQYVKEVQAMLEQLGGATHRVMASPGAQILNLAVLPTFGTQWLVRQLPDFSLHFPQVTVNLATRIRPFAFAEEAFDAAIHHGQPVWPGAVLHHLMDETLWPVASPKYAGSALLRPGDLRKATLLHQATRLGAWAEWHERAGLPTKDAYRGPVYDQFGMVAAAAAAGLGVGLLPEFMVEEQLRTRDLVALFDLPLSTASAYYVAVPEGAHKRVADEFAAWAVRRSGSDARGSLDQTEEVGGGPSLASARRSRGAIPK